MKIVVAPDSFKGSLSSVEAASAIRRGILSVLPSASVVELPVADGGEGTTKMLLRETGGKFVHCEVTGPLGDAVATQFGVTEDGTMAIIEMAAASGLLLVPAHLRNPRIATTFGTGELIRSALDEGVEVILIGLGESATNDGGAGMTEALGVRFLDKDGVRLARGGTALLQLHGIDISGKDPRISKTQFEVACDVQNPLTGSEGASTVYGPQKGATPEDVKLLDEALERYAEVIWKSLGIDVKNVASAGAAGGLGAGLVAFCGAQIRRGIDVVLDALAFDQHVKDAALVVTGEGKLDAQTQFGKVLSGILERCRKTGTPAAAVVGILEGERSEFAGKDIF